MKNSLVECPSCLSNVEQFHPRSHIIPAFIVKSIGDEKGRVFILGADGTRKVSQSGYYKSIVCNACEVKFGHCDTFFARCFKDKIIPFQVEGKFQESFDYEIWSGLNSEILYKFCLSIIIRSHLFNRAENKGDLVGDKHFRRISDIFQGGKFVEKDYPIIIRKLWSSQNLETIIHFPIKMRIDGHNTIKWTFFGLEFTVLISSHNKPDCFKDFFLKENGTCIVIIENFEESQKVLKFAHQYKKMRKN